MSTAENVPRRAVAEDRDEFLEMAREYLHELRKAGSEVRPTARTLAAWGHLFDNYLRGAYAGVVVIAPGVGFSMAGETGASPFDTDFGRSAYSWGTYVRQEHRGNGVSGELRRLLRAGLVEAGFDTVLGGVHLDNRAGRASLRRLGFRFHQMLGFEQLSTKE